MSSRISQYGLLALAGVGVAAMTLIYLPMMPERMATHFDSAGNPNGWASPAAFSISMALIFAGAAALFLIAGMVENIPNRWINLPARDYWLAPARRDETFAFLRCWMRNLVLLNVVFLTAVHWLVLQANLQGPPRLGAAVWWLLGVYAVVTLGCVGVMLWRFRPPAGAPR